MTAVDYTIQDDIAVLSVDHPPVNALSLVVRQALKEGFEAALGDPAIRAIVLLGGGKTFIAGADISEFGTPKSAMAPRLQDIQRLLDASHKPVVAAIHGTALGGGLEIALACHARIAVASARIGLPEVTLGLLPGASGTVRLPRLVGAEAALDLIVSGAHVPAQKALELGAIDAIVEDLQPDAIAFARQLAKTGTPVPVSRRTDRIAGTDPGLFDRFREKVARKIHGQSAPDEIIKCVEAASFKPFEEALAFERERFLALMDGPQRKALIHYFFAEREARKIPGVPADTAPSAIERVAVIGSGTMGGGIAMVFANAGIAVQLVDISAETLARGIAVIENNYATSVSRGSMTEAATRQALSLIRTTSDYDDLGEVDLVVEAAFEDMDLKQTIFTKLDQVTPRRAILASNTSSLDIDAIAIATSRPEKVIGIHFFSPANVMKLQENVRGKASSVETIATVMGLAKRIGKIPVLAGNCDGFIGNRMLQYYTGEAEFMLEQGATPVQIDRVAEQFGMPMGPLAMRDLSGIDVGVQVRKARRGSLPAGERLSPIVEMMAEAGRLGQKTGKGFYRYEGRNRLPDPEALAIIEAASREFGIKRREFSDEEICDRLFHPLVNEGAKELEDGTALRASDVDVVWVNGYGFPSYRGGPMFWGQSGGLDRVLETARRLGAQNGPRWYPSPLLEELVATGLGWAAVVGGKVQKR